VLRLLVESRGLGGSHRHFQGLSKTLNKILTQRRGTGCHESATTKINDEPGPEAYPHNQEHNPKPTARKHELMELISFYLRYITSGNKGERKKKREVGRV